MGVDRLVVATRTVQAYFYQFFVEGFFHADPHPGNIFLKRDSDPSDPVIAFIDFGMVGRLTKTMKKSLTGLFLAVLGRDPHNLVNSLKSLGFIGEKANMAAIEKGLGLMMDQYFGMTLGEARNLEISNVAQEVEELMYGQPFQVPAQFAFSGRAVSTLVGVATGLAPSFNFVDVATPYARKFLGLDAEGAGQTIQQVLQQLLESGRLLLTLPRALERIVNKLEAGQIEVKVSPTGQTSRNGRGRHRRNGNGGVPATQGAGPGLAWPVMFLASLGGGVFLTYAHQTTTGWFCLGLSGVIALIGLLRR
jgi:predicted unusual protein kinase regulating ubiquinone biosynthesis (AarF/ABC1/UbiB family)